MPCVILTVDGDSQRAINGGRAMTSTLAGNGVTCPRCRFHVRHDAQSEMIPDVMAVHWFDHHGLVEWRDVAAEARYRMATTGHGDVLDQLVAVPLPLRMVR